MGIEIKDEELKQVSGGDSSSSKTYYLGDVYLSKSNVCYVVIDEVNTSGAVNCDYYNFSQIYGIDDYIGKASISRLFFKSYTFLKHIDNYNVK